MNSEYSFKKMNEEIRCDLHINGQLVATGIDLTKKGAKAWAAEKAVESLRETNYTVKIKVKHLSDSCEVIDKDSTSGQGKNSQATEHVPIGDGNVGSKLMRLMGWSGGGLGKDNQGIEEPIHVQRKINRAGLGLNKMDNITSGLSQFRDKIQQMLYDYKNKDSDYDLVFSSEYSKEERAVMHQVALKLNLKAKSYGKGEDRYLVVSKKVQFWMIVNNLLQSGGSSEKYELVNPTGRKKKQ